MATDAQLMALQQLNAVHALIEGVAESVEKALADDGRMSRMEAFGLLLQVGAMAPTLLTLFQSMNKADIQALLSVLRHGRWTLPEG